MNIITETKKLLFGPTCKLCGNRKKEYYKEKYYCGNCERHILDFEICKDL